MLDLVVPDALEELVTPRRLDAQLVGVGERWWERWVGGRDAVSVGCGGRWCDVWWDVVGCVWWGAGEKNLDMQAELGNCAATRAIVRAVRQVC